MLTRNHLRNLNGATLAALTATLTWIGTADADPLALEHGLAFTLEKSERMMHRRRNRPRLFKWHRRGGGELGQHGLQGLVGMRVAGHSAL